MADLGRWIPGKSLFGRVRPYLDVRLLIFPVAFVLVTLLVIELPTTNAFWQVMNLRFSKDQRYQLQRISLPDQGQFVPLVVSGDAMFQSAVDRQVGALDGARRIVVNGYDPDDARALFSVIYYGERYTKTRVCNLLLQVSPNFAVRAKSFDVPQAYGLLSTYAGTKKLEYRIKDFFLIINQWFQAHDDGDLMAANSDRLARHVGQTRFADPTEENWQRAFGRLNRFHGKVLGVLDTRGTDWGEGSNLIQETERLLQRLSKRSAAFSWVRLEDLDRSALPVCDKKKPANDH